jgi:hypothetical protein
VAISQTVFLPNIGTSWHYLFAMRQPNTSLANVEIRYLKDTVYNGEVVKVLLTPRIYLDCNYSHHPRTFVKQRNDSVWFMHERTNYSWQLVMDFNATAGKKWTYGLMSQNNYLITTTVTVNAVGNNMVNNLTLKTLSVSYSYYDYQLHTYTTTISERFGTSFLFNTGNFNPGMNCDGDYRSALLCYEDSAFGLKQFTDLPCDFSNPTNLFNHDPTNFSLEIFPNPASSSVNFQVSEPIIYSLYNMIGVKIWQRNFVRGQQKIDITELSSGIYFLKDLSNKKQAKFIKE